MICGIVNKSDTHWNEFRFGYGSLLFFFSSSILVLSNLPTIVIDYVLPEFLAQLAQNAILVEELALVAMLKVLGDALSHVTRQLPVRHILFHLFNLHHHHHHKQRKSISVSLSDTVSGGVDTSGKTSHLFAILSSTGV